MHYERAKPVVNNQAPTSYVTQVVGRRRLDKSETDLLDVEEYEQHCPG